MSNLCMLKIFAVDVSFAAFIRALPQNAVTEMIIVYKTIAYILEKKNNDYVNRLLKFS